MQIRYIPKFFFYACCYSAVLRPLLDLFLTHILLLIFAFVTSTADMCTVSLSKNRIWTALLQQINSRHILCSMTTQILIIFWDSARHFFIWE